MAYTTVADLKTYMDISTSTDDALLTVLIGAAQKQIETLTGRVFEVAADSTRVYTPLGPDYGGNLWIDGITLGLDYDLCQLTSITNGDGANIPTNAVSLLPLNGVPYSAIRIKLNQAYAWTYTGSPDGSVSIVGRWGYSITPPADVVELTKETAARMYRRRNGTENRITDSISADAVFMPAYRLPDDIAKLLTPYRRIGW